MDATDDLGLVRRATEPRPAAHRSRAIERRPRGLASPHADTGTTLIETLVVIAILAVLLGTAVPSFARMLASHRVTTSTNDLVHAIATTRAEALRRNGRVYLAPRDEHWKNGWAVFIDRNDNRTYDGPRGSPSGGPPDDTIVLHDPMPASIDVGNSSGSALEPFSDGLSPHRSYVMFDGNGYSRQRNGALHFGGIVLSDRAGGNAAVRTICLGSYGRVRVVVGHAGC